MTLKVIGNDGGKGVFKVGNINGGNGANKTIDVEGTTLKTENISGPMNTDGDMYDPIENVRIKNGTIEANGVANVVDVALTGGSFVATMTTAADGTPTGGDITISGQLSGQGLVKAADTLAITNDLTTADVDDLRLEGKTVNTKKLDFTEGTVTTVATENLTTTGGATLNGDVVLAQNWTLASTDTVKASGNSYQLVGQFSADSGADPEGVSSLNTTYTVEGVRILKVYPASIPPIRWKVSPCSCM